MRNTFHSTAAILIGLLFAAACQAAVVFNFKDGQTGVDLDNLENGTSTVGGITLTAAADGTAGTDLFNQTGTGFGINANGSGDDTDAFDGVNGAEVMNFSFDRNLVFFSISFDRFSSGEQGQLAFTGGSTFNFDDTDLVSNVLTVNESVAAGQSISLKWVSGNGWGLKDINVGTVPEPSSLALLGFGALALLRARIKARA